jgi:hypothetical protein
VKPTSAVKEIVNGMHVNVACEMSLSDVDELRTMTLAPNDTFMPCKLDDSGTLMTHIILTLSTG